MRLITDSLEQGAFPLNVGPFARVSQALLEPSPRPFVPSQVAEDDWTQVCLDQAARLYRLTERAALRLKRGSKSAHKQQARILQVLCTRRRKDAERLAAVFMLPVPAVSAAPELTAEIPQLEDMLADYRWQQRLFLCAGWLAESQGDEAAAQALMACAECLLQDYAFLESACARTQPAPQPVRFSSLRGAL